MKQFKVEVYRMDGSKYCKAFSTAKDADKFVDRMRSKVLAIGPVEKITTEKDVFAAMLDAVESRM